jgi:hypothetical protein
MAHTSATAQSVTYRHDDTKMNQFTVAEIGSGTLTPELYYSISHSNYKKTAAAKNKLGYRTTTGISWCFLDFLSYVPNAIGSYTHDLYQAEALQITDKFEEVQQLIYVRDTLYTNLQAQADVARSGTMDPSLVEATMEQTGVDEVTNMEKDASKLWFTSLVSGATVCIDKIVMAIALIVFRIGWWSTIYCQQILLGMLTIFGPIQWAFSLLPKWEGAWAKWLIRYLTVHFYGAMLYFVIFYSKLQVLLSMICKISKSKSNKQVTNLFFIFRPDTIAA